MVTYLVLNVVFMIVTCIVVGVSLRKKPSKALIITFTALLLLTLVFDNILIHLSMFSYEPTKILGATIGVAPVEDFMYAILAVTIIPIIWSKLGNRTHAK